MHCMLWNEKDRRQCGKNRLKGKKEKKKEGLYDSHNSTEHIVHLTHRPVPLRPHHWLTELDSDSCSVTHCNASQGQERSMGTFQRVPSLSAPEQLPDLKVT